MAVCMHLSSERRLAVTVQASLWFLVAVISELCIAKKTVSSEVIRTSFYLLYNCFPNPLSQLLLNKIDAFS